MLKRSNSEEVIKFIGEIKKGFDKAEEIRPGFSDKFVALILENLNV